MVEGGFLAGVKCLLTLMARPSFTGAQTHSKLRHAGKKTLKNKEAVGQKAVLVGGAAPEGDADGFGSRSLARQLIGASLVDLRVPSLPITT